MIEKMWSQAFPYLPVRIKREIRKGWKGALVYIVPAFQFRRTQLRHLTLFLPGVETEPGMVAVAIGTLVSDRARKFLGEPIGIL